MPFNGSGVFSAPAASFPAVTGTVIDSTKYNNVVNDVASGLTNCITKDGQTTVTANLPMATYRHTGVGNAAALTDYATADQVVDNALTHGGASAAGTDTYAVSLAISPGAYAAKQRFQFIADVDNTGACTININGLGAKSIKLADGSDPHTGFIKANSVVDVIYDGTNFILQNPFLAPKLASTDDVIDNFPAGTLMLFQQTLAPTGWTKQTTHNDKALRVVSGAASSGGSSAFSTVFGKTATDSHTLTSADIPAHTHAAGTLAADSGGAHDHAGTYANIDAGGSTSGMLYKPTAASGATSGSVLSGGAHTHTISGSTGSYGSGGGHTHNMDIQVQYIDIIIASKD